MTYVEWLRVRNVLRVTAIVLGALIVLALAVRLSLMHYGSVDAYVNQLRHEQGAKVSTTTLPDGTRRTTIDTPKGEHVVIDDRGYRGQHIVITQAKRGTHDGGHLFVGIGSVRVDESTTGNKTTTVADTDSATPFYYLLGFAQIVALIVATVLAAPFARENDGHLELALTKPIRRDAYALRTMGVDALGILAAAALTIVAAMVSQTIFEVPRYEFGGPIVFVALITIVLPLAWYAMLAAATASMRRSHGVLLGLSWPIVGITLLLAALPMQGSIVGVFVHAVAHALSWLIPVSYVNFNVSYPTTGTPTFYDPTFGPRFAAVTLLTLIYGALAVWQWRRVEA